MADRRSDHVQPTGLDGETLPDLPGGSRRVVVGGLFDDTRSADDADCQRTHDPD